MATSESDLSDKSMKVCGDKSNRATFFFQHVSDEEDINQSSEDTNTTYSSSCDDKKDNDTRYPSTCDNAIDTETIDHKNKNTSMYFGEEVGYTDLRYTKAEIDHLVTEAERIVANHFMDMSSPNSDDNGRVSCSSLGTCSASDDFYSAQSENLHGNMITYRHLDTGSLFSFGLWDQETYLTEHLYEDSIEEEKVKELLEFGDDYHNCIGSISESPSVANESVPTSCRRLRKRRRKKMADDNISTDSDSESDLDDTSDIIANSYDKLDTIKKRTAKLFSGRNIKEENLIEYNEVAQLGSDYLQNLIPLLQSIKFDNSFSSTKRNCEIRCLLTKWTGVLHKIRDNIKEKNLNNRLEVKISTQREDADEKNHEKVSDDQVRMRQRVCKVGKAKAGLGTVADGIATVWEGLAIISEGLFKVWKGFVEFW